MRTFYKCGETVGEVEYGGEVAKRPYEYRRDLFICRCGKAFIARRDHVESKFTTSCGCIRSQRSAERRLKHGQCRIGKQTSEYIAWSAMKERCSNPLSSSYEIYGGRGIKVCDRWTASFINFFEDIGPKPSSQHSLERLDVDGNYEPSNCKWATKKEQDRNKRTTKIVVFNGVSKPLLEWVEELGLEYTLVSSRLHKGWTIEKAFFQEKQKLGKRPLYKDVQEPSLHPDRP